MMVNQTPEVAELGLAVSGGPAPSRLEITVPVGWALNTNN